jgi:hypothetical protein
MEFLTQGTQKIIWCALCYSCCVPCVIIRTTYIELLNYNQINNYDNE